METCKTDVVQTPKGIPNAHKFQPGQSGNPKGRAKKEHCFADIARAMLASKEINITLTTPDGQKKNIGLKADKSFRHAMITGLIREAMKGNVQAAKELMDRTDGKVTDELNVSSDNAVRITFTEVRPKEKAPADGPRP